MIPLTDSHHALLPLHFATDPGEDFDWQSPSAIYSSFNLHPNTQLNLLRNYLEIVKVALPDWFLDLPDEMIQQVVRCSGSSLTSPYFKFIRLITYIYFYLFFSVQQVLETPGPVRGQAIRQHRQEIEEEFWETGPEHVHESVQQQIRRTRGRREQQPTSVHKTAEENHVGKSELYLVSIHPYEPTVALSKRNG